MKKEEVSVYLGKRIKLTCIFGSGEPIFYSGTIQQLNETTFDFLDKFDKIIRISYEVIKQVDIL